MIKSLDTKIADIRANPSGSKAFIIADAKDADMAFGIVAPGPRRNSKINEYDSSWKSLTAEEAVKAYHDVLKKLGIKPLREFADDKELTGTMTRYR
jgi:hypothetical protein